MANNELTEANAQYDDIVKRIVDAGKSNQRANLMLYHNIGTMFTEFVTGMESNRYGDATVDKLADELREKEALGAIKDVRRFLYWAKNLSDAYPEVDNLMALAARGFTVTHAKLMFALSDELRDKVSTELIQDGAIISTRELHDLVRELRQEAIEGAVDEASAQVATDDNVDSSEIFESTDPAAGEGIEVVGGTASAATPDLGEGPAVENAPGEAELAQQAAASEPVPDAAGRTGAPARERTVRSPLKTLAAVEKHLTSVCNIIPDAFIVIREVSQEGFDSDAANTKYLNQLQAVKVMASAVIDPVSELISSIEAEERAANVPAPE